VSTAEELAEGLIELLELGAPELSFEALTMAAGAFAAYGDSAGAVPPDGANTWLAAIVEGTHKHYEDYSERLDGNESGQGRAVRRLAEIGAGRQDLN
jgi:hypothetical protein